MRYPADTLNKWSCGAVAVLVVLAIALLIVILLMSGLPPFALREGC